MNKDIVAYNNKQEEKYQEICELLTDEIANVLGTEDKIWHGSPVWFLDGNPIAGYDILKDSVRLLFWSGQSFNEPDLKNEGSFKAAEIRFTNINQIDTNALKRWLEKSKKIQWDYKNIVKRRGKLERIMSTEQASGMPIHE